MKKNWIWILASTITITGIFYYINTANAVPVSNPAAQYGNENLCSGGAPCAAKVPATSSLIPRTGVMVQNLAATPIWCGFDSSVTDLNGIYVQASGGVYMANIDNISAAVPTPGVWCYSQAAQAAPNNIRWQEIRSAYPTH